MISKNRNRLTAEAAEHLAPCREDLPARKASIALKLVGDGRSFKVNEVIAGNSIDIEVR